MKSVTTMAAVGAAFIALSVPALAQLESRGDTLKMTCTEARALIKNKGGTLLNTGPNIFNLYHSRGATCDKLGEGMEPALVRTRDNPLCFIGYTCEMNAE
jgi:hypothetical protein